MLGDITKAYVSRSVFVFGVSVFGGERVGILGIMGACFVVSRCWKFRKIAYDEESGLVDLLTAGPWSLSSGRTTHKEIIVSIRLISA